MENSWVQAWKEGRTNFHRPEYHEKLIQYFPRFQAQPGQKIFVPLCGKSKDMLWLHEQELEVHGVELYEGAVQAFFEENRLPTTEVSKECDFIRYSIQGIHLRCGDFFKTPENGAYDFVYDRGALVAISPELRERYATVIRQVIKKGGKYLLIAYEYDGSEMEGPPFHLDRKEIERLYGKNFSIEFLENEKPLKEGPRLSAVGSLRQTIYLLQA